MGTSTVGLSNHSVDPLWGKTCVRFLKRLYRHGSKASKTYYFKNHLQYFASLFKSIREISRVLKRRGKCVIVMTCLVSSDQELLENGVHWALS